MALSPQEQNKIVQLLGYGAKSIQAGSVIYDKMMNDRLHTIPPDAEDLIRSYLASVAAIEQMIADAPARLAAKKVDGLEMNLHELPQLRSERKKIAREISQLVDIPYIGVNGSNIGVAV